MDVAELAARLQRLEDERAILDNLHQYGHSIDVGLDERWVDCFVPDGRFEVRRRLDPSNVTRCEGSAELREFVAHHTRPPDKYHKHLVVDACIELDGDQATSVSYFVRVDAVDGGRSVVHAIGRYHDRLVRCPDGRWRFVERRAEVEDR